MFKKIVICVVLLSTLSACASFSKITAENRTRLNRLSVGMTKEQVLQIMGTETIETGSSPAVVTNPHRSETLKSESGKLIEVLFYYTDVKAQDGVITDDELTPIVIEDRKLVGWGNSFYTNVKKIEVRYR